MIQYTHRYSLTAADMDTRYRMTPTAVYCRRCADLERRGLMTPSGRIYPVKN